MTEDLAQSIKDWIVIGVTLSGAFTAVNAWFMRKFAIEPRELRTRIDTLEKRIVSGDERFKRLDEKLDDQGRDMNEVKVTMARIDGKLSMLVDRKGDG